MTTEIRKPMAAFICKGPPTYMNVEEAWHRFWGRRSGAVLIVLVPRGNPYKKLERLQEVIDESMWERIEWVFLRSNVLYRRDRKGVFQSISVSAKRRAFFFFIDRIQLDRLSRRLGKCDVVVSGHNDVQEHLAAQLQPKQFFLIDSGLTVVSRVEKSGYIDYRERLSPKWSKYLKTIGYRVVDRDRAFVFSSYAESLETNHTVIENDHGKKKDQASRMDVSKAVLWISTPLVDRYGVAIRDYVGYIRTTIHKLGYRAEDIIFVPHPGKESRQNVDAIVASLGCKLDDRLIPVEKKVLSREKLPSACISPYSSSLVNIAQFSGDKIRIISAWHHEFSLFPVLLNWRRALENESANEVSFVEVSDGRLFGVRDDRSDYTFPEIRKRRKRQDQE